ncbi:hypothetical protein [Flavobacterium sp.]|uniref:hypothetical protein n=1 Tax=Flavobacterium sp. TaxID=239 RepID=UPI00286D7FCF|nr:hypothetical protein [Flavobacterium sp.]
MTTTKKMILAALVAGVVAFGVLYFIDNLKNTPLDQAQVDLKAVVKQINSQCPIKVDETTRLDSTSKKMVFC